MVTGRFYHISPELRRSAIYAMAGFALIGVCSLMFLLTMLISIFRASVQPNPSMSKNRCLRPNSANENAKLSYGLLR